jgi:ankyrin repeat protein
MNLKTLLKHLKILFLSSILILQSCRFCSEEELKVLKAGENGDFEVVKEYLENGGNPLLQCHSGEGRFGTYYSLSYCFASTDSYEWLDYYLYNYSSSLPQEELDYMLFVINRNINYNLIPLLLKYGATAFYLANKGYYFEQSKEQILKLIELGYDINTLDEDGNTLFMMFCRWPAPVNEESLLSMLAFLIEHGAKTDIKNKKGKTAKDLAVNENVKKYLESL